MRTIGCVSVLASICLLEGCQLRYSDHVSVDGPSFDPSAFGAPQEPSVVDTRPVTSASTPPPPISGGTLMVTRDGQIAVAADPDRDRVSIVSIADRVLLHTVQLEPGDEPGRVVEDGAGRAHVALRRGGAIVAIDLATGAIVSRRPVCGVPRGIAYDAPSDLLHVACAGGELVTFSAGGGDAIRRVTLDVDLRDVVVTPGGLFVSRFKSAELLRVDGDGALVGRIGTHGVDRLSDKIVAPSFSSDGTQTGGFDQGQVVEPVEPAVAWRTVAAPDGTIQVLHQYALAAPIVLDDPKASGVTAPSPQPYGAPLGGCGGLVQAGVSSVDADGTVHMGAPIPGAVLTVDAAVSPDSRWIALAQAGTRDPDAPLSGSGSGSGIAGGFQSDPFSGGLISIVEAGATGGAVAPGTGPTPCASQAFEIGVSGQTTAVAFNPGSYAVAEASGVWLVVQTREPATLVLLRDPTGGQRTTVDLGGPSVVDTGHDIFHRDSGSGIACASCHPEGGEDGRVWQFHPLGNRRTQAVDVGLEGTAPFHWDGDMPTFSALVEEVFVHRMGGPEEAPERSAALSQWVFSLKPRSPIVDEANGANPGATRGRALFESSAVGCASCHGGPAFTANINADVGTTEPGQTLQVPSLRGVGYRAPFLHDGRAATLRERFDPAKGGGDAHGHTSTLSDADIGDLVSYLESI